MSRKRKLKTLNLGEKLKIIQPVNEVTRKKKDIAAEFNIPRSTLSIILKNHAMKVVLSKRGKERLSFLLLSNVWRSDLSNAGKKVTLGGQLIKEKAMQLIDKCWRNVTEKMMINYLKKCAFGEDEPEDPSEIELEL